MINSEILFHVPLGMIGLLVAEIVEDVWSSRPTSSSLQVPFPTSYSLYFTFNYFLFPLFGMNSFLYAFLFPSYVCQCLERSAVRSPNDICLFIQVSLLHTTTSLVTLLKVCLGPKPVFAVVHCVFTVQYATSALILVVDTRLVRRGTSDVRFRDYI